MRVAIIGAGPAGLAAAYQLVRGGAEVEVFESGPAVGGMARSIRLWDQIVDLGPHRFFSGDPRVNGLWREVVGNDYTMVDRLTRIYYQGRFFRYPLQPRDALTKMGLWEAARCAWSYLNERLSRARPGDEEPSFESWVVRRFGQRLYEMFFKSYSEKLWGISGRDLDADFAAQRIKNFSLAEAVKHALGLARQQHKTLVERFAYPLGGTGVVYERMAERVRADGGKVELSTPVLRLLHCRKEICGLELADGSRPEFDHVISTMPLTLLVRGLDGIPQEVRQAADSLEFRNTILVYLRVEGTGLFDDQWLYLHSPDLLAGRMTNFSNWGPGLGAKEDATLLALEYWCNDPDPLWAESEQDLIGRAAHETRMTGLLGNRAVLDGHVFRLRRSYPVYRRGYRQHVDRIMEFLAGFEGLSAIGRYGAFKYNNQDHSILMGILAAENLLQGKHHDLASVNTDYDSYQEAAPIAQTGLDEVLAGAERK
jgi:protoporphyrinogen oxidase